MSRTYTSVEATDTVWIIDDADAFGEPTDSDLSFTDDDLWWEPTATLELALPELDALVLETMTVNSFD